MDDLISRQAAIAAFDCTNELIVGGTANAQNVANYINKVIGKIKALPSAQPELLTDKEQRIFLAAMGREKKVCQEVDRNYTREPYEDSLMSVCREIERKVKGALWT